MPTVFCVIGIAIIAILAVIGLWMYLHRGLFGMRAIATLATTIVVFPSISVVVSNWFQFEVPGLNIMGSVVVILAILSLALLTAWERWLTHQSQRESELRRFRLHCDRIFELHFVDEMQLKDIAVEIDETLDFVEEAVHTMLSTRNPSGHKLRKRSRSLWPIDPAHDRFSAKRDAGYVRAQENHDRPHGSFETP